MGEGEERQGGEGGGDAGMEAGRGAEGMQRQKRTRARAGQIPDMKQAERRPETAGCREKGKERCRGREVEIGSERTEEVGVWEARETGVRVGTGRERGGGRGVERGPQGQGEHKGHR